MGWELNSSWAMRPNIMIPVDPDKNQSIFSCTPVALLACSAVARFVLKRGYIRSLKEKKTEN